MFESHCRYHPKRRQWPPLRVPRFRPPWAYGPLVKRLRHRPFTAVTWVRFPYGSPNHPNTLDQWAKSPVISRCSGFFMTGNFQTIPWINGSVTEVRTGFEPLFFHIQGDFCSQRPFSEGCGGEIPEKRRKIFHKVMGVGLLVFTNQ